MRALTRRSLARQNVFATTFVDGGLRISRGAAGGGGELVRVFTRLDGGGAGDDGGGAAATSDGAAADGAWDLSGEIDDGLGGDGGSELFDGDAGGGDSMDYLPSD